MPKTTEKSKAQIHAEDLRAKAKKAKENLAKKPEDKTLQAAYKHANELASAAELEANKDRFKTYANGRFQSLKTAVKLLARLANRNSYEYTQEQADILLASIKAEIPQIEAAFKAAAAGGPKTAKVEKPLFE